MSHGYILNQPADQILQPPNPSGDHTSCKELNVSSWPIVNQVVFRGFAGEFVKFAIENSEADSMAVLMTFLSYFGVEVGRNPYVVAGDRQHARINVVLVGQSSKARKGTSVIPVKLLFNIPKKWWEGAQFSPGPLSTGEGGVNAVRDEHVEYQINRKTGKGEYKVVDPGVSDKRMIIIDQEFAAALSCSKREGNTLTTVIRLFYDGSKVEPLTKNSKISATDPHVAIVAHITTHELKQKMNKVEAFNGLANRFAWVCVRRSKLVAFPKELDEKVLQSFQERLVEILRFSSTQDEITLSSDARELWAKIYPSLTKEFGGLLGAVLGRAETNVLRFALLYALLDCSSEITVHHLQAALALWKYCEQSAEFIFGELETDTIERRIMDALHEKDGLDTRSLYDIFTRNIKKDDLEAALKSLIASSRIRLEKQKSGGRGRPRNIYYLDELNELNE